ncbi:hypothetical protein [Pseudoalteromonas luteoviolacea]|nr:hypothetical protein [Pseudoalteromonas luteoviolacea]MBE0385418.1 hypothetical protein [Pseudoalteromonas luteoviolacea DSM 6061]
MRKIVDLFHIFTSNRSKYRVITEKLLYWAKNRNLSAQQNT